MLCDVSTSRDQRVASSSSRVLHALHDSFRKMRSFVFIERISEVTDVFEKERDFKAVSEAIGRDAGVADISGYTDYGRVWHGVPRRWSRTTCTRARPSSCSATRAPTAATRAPTSSPTIAAQGRPHVLAEPRAAPVLELRRLGDLRLRAVLRGLRVLDDPAARGLRQGADAARWTAWRSRPIPRVSWWCAGGAMRPCSPRARWRGPPRLPRAPRGCTVSFRSCWHLRAARVGPGGGGVRIDSLTAVVFRASRGGATAPASSSPRRRGPPRPGRAPPARRPALSGARARTRAGQRRVPARRMGRRRCAASLGRALRAAASQALPLRGRRRRGRQARRSGGRRRRAPPAAARQPAPLPGRRRETVQYAARVQGESAADRQRDLQRAAGVIGRCGHYAGRRRRSYAMAQRRRSAR